jgi:hypothetical protein
MAVLLWRQRQFLQAEGAEISNMSFAQSDAIFKILSQTLCYARQGRGSDQPLDHDDDIATVKNAIHILTTVRLGMKFNDRQDEKNIAFIKRLLAAGQGDQVGDYFLRIINEIQRLTLVFANESEREQDPGQRDANMGKLIEAEVRRLTKLFNEKIHNDLVKTSFDDDAACIPSRAFSDHFMRSEAHISRELDRVANRLERSQRMRKGQPLPPQFEFKVC